MASEEQIPTARWYYSAHMIGWAYVGALAKRNPSGTTDWAKQIRALDYSIRSAVMSGELKTQGYISGPFLPAEEASYFNGLVNLQRFCDWALSAGIDDCPRDAHQLAKAFDMEGTSTAESESGVNAVRAAPPEQAPAFVFPESHKELSLWDLACRITGQNALDAQPTNETRDQIQGLVQAVYSNQLPVVFAPGSDFCPVSGVMPAALRDSLKTDWQKLHLIMVRQEDWASFARVVDINKRAHGIAMPVPFLHSAADEGAMALQAELIADAEKKIQHEAWISSQGMYRLGVVAAFIAKQEKWPKAGALESIERSMIEAANRSELLTRDEYGGPIREPATVTTLSIVSRADVNRWLTEQGRGFVWRDDSALKAALEAQKQNGITEDLANIAAGLSTLAMGAKVVELKAQHALESSTIAQKLFAELVALSEPSNARNRNDRPKLDATSRGIQAAEKAASGWAPPAEDELGQPVQAMTRKALIGAHEKEWTTIMSDLKNASSNGLAKVAKLGERGWNEANALEWARANGKLISVKSAAFNLQNTMSELPSRKHRLGG